jgi:hypothetical protein
MGLNGRPSILKEAAWMEMEWTASLIPGYSRDGNHHSKFADKHSNEKSIISGLVAVYKDGIRLPCRVTKVAASSEPLPEG